MILSRRTVHDTEHDWKVIMKARILVVEDEFFIAQEIVDAVESAGFEVLGPCPTVQKALTKLEDSQCDAAILDVSLRNENSLPVVQALNARGIPFVVLTGFSASQLPAEMTVAPIMTKPLHDEALIGELRKLLANR